MPASLVALSFFFKVILFYARRVGIIQKEIATKIQSAEMNVCDEYRDS
jgi:hypothetical protein